MNGIDINDFTWPEMTSRLRDVTGSPAFATLGADHRRRHPHATGRWIVVEPRTVPGTDTAAGVLEHDADGSGAAVLAALARLAAAVAVELVAGGLTIVGITGARKRCSPAGTGSPSS